MSDVASLLHTHTIHQSYIGQLRKLAVQEPALAT